MLLDEKVYSNRLRLFQFAKIFIECQVMAASAFDPSRRQRLVNC